MKPYFFLQSGDTYHLKVNPSCSKYTHEETVRYPCILHARILMDTPMRSPFQILDHSMTIDCKEDMIKTHKCKTVYTKMVWSGQGYHYPPPPPNPPSQPSLTFSRTHSGTVRIKCFAQEHSTLTGPGLNPRCLDLELSALMPLRLYRIKQASLLLLVTCWNWFSFSLCLSNHHHHYYCQRIIANIFITIKISII